MKKFVCRNFVPFWPKIPLSVSFIVFACRFSHCPWLILCQGDYFDGSTWITATVGHIKLYPYRSEGAATVAVATADSTAMCTSGWLTRLAKSCITTAVRIPPVEEDTFGFYAPSGVNELIDVRLVAKGNPKRHQKATTEWQSGIECA